MFVVPGFAEGAQVAHPFGRPKLTGPFEATLALATTRFDRPRADRVAALMVGELAGVTSSTTPSGLRTNNSELARAAPRTCFTWSRA